MKLSKNLTLAEVVRSETAKRLNIDNTPTDKHIENLKLIAAEVFQPIRDHFKKPIYVSSGYRSELLNRQLKGVSGSRHCTGQALDIDMDHTEITNAEVFNFIKDNLEFDTLIWEYGNEENPAWVHVAYVEGKNRKNILKATKDGYETI